MDTYVVPCPTLRGGVPRVRDGADWYLTPAPPCVGMAPQSRRPLLPASAGMAHGRTQNRPRPTIHGGAGARCCQAALRVWWMASPPGGVRVQSTSSALPVWNWWATRFVPS